MSNETKGKIVLVGTEKGGTGKTTTAINLAVLRAKAGRDVLLVDTDPQGSASDWIAARDDAGITPRVNSVQKFGKGLARELDDLSTRYQDIIVDAGGRDSVELRAAMTRANILIAPIQASHFDLWTLRRLDELVQQALPFNENLKVIIVISRAPTNPLVTDANDANELIADFECFSPAKRPICERVSFRRSAGGGMGVIEYTPADEKAVFEIQSLYKEIWHG